MRAALALLRIASWLGMLFNAAGQQGDTQSQSCWKRTSLGGLHVWLGEADHRLQSGGACSPHLG